MTTFFITLATAIGLLLVFILLMAARTLFTKNGKFGSTHACSHDIETSRCKRQKTGSEIHDATR